MNPIRWFLAGAFSMIVVFTLFYLLLIVPMERSIESSVAEIIAQRDSAMAENTKLRTACVVDRRHDTLLSPVQPSLSASAPTKGSP